MNPVHWLFDKLYPPIRFLYERIQGHAWFDQLTPNLWIGGAPTYQRDYDFLVDNGITAVLDLRAEREDDVRLLAHNNIDYMRIEVLDVTVPPPEAIDAGVDFIHRHVQEGGVVLVHCAKGRGRSATLVAAYLMGYEGQSFDEANDFMVAKRPLVNLQRRHESVLDSWVGQFRARETPEPNPETVTKA
jgi:protein-tyrosine phosphatase